MATIAYFSFAVLPFCPIQNLRITVYLINFKLNTQEKQLENELKDFIIFHLPRIQQFFNDLSCAVISAAGLQL